MKAKKTNATRLLDKLNIDYQIVEYQVNLTDLSAEHVSRELGIPLNQIFKTLVAHGDKTGEMVACVPGNSELNLKTLARISGNKKVQLIPTKEINKRTGYIRGSVSPLGLKYSYPLYIDRSALQHQFILISAGLRGLQIKINPQDLITACHMKVESLAA
jgi:Cys-tRNA(Pro)/Cys-tRNA(Cys) deacylase